MNNSRSANSLRNTLFAAISYMFKTLLSFVVRAVFVRKIAVEYLGLNGLFTNVLNVLSLAELGVGNAIVFSMYKPIADNDTDKINSFVALYRKLYLVIGSVITIAGLSIIPALPFLIKDAPNVDINLTVVYVLYLAQTVIGYFFAYRRALIFAYQRNDIESKVSFISTVFMSIAQIAVILILGNYYAYVIIMVIATTIDSLIVYIVSFKLFPQIRGHAQPLNKETKQGIIKNTGALVFHKLGYAVVFSTDSIIISSFVGAAALGVYSNYTMVISALLSIVTIFVTAVRSSVGNMISLRHPDDVYKIYSALNFVFMWIVAFFTIGAFCCFQDFILVLTSDKDFQLPFLTVLLICISFYLTSSRRMTDAFKECAGLFWNDRFKPLAEAGINLGLDFLLVYFWGINGVILATIISTIVAPLWVEPYVLYKNFFHKSVGKYFLRYLIYLIIGIAVGIATFCATYFIPLNGVSGFIVKFLVSVILPNSLFFIVYCRTSEFKYIVEVFKRLINGRKMRNNENDKKECVKLDPVIKDYIWGGNKLKKEFGICCSGACAEAWMCSFNKNGETDTIDGKPISAVFDKDTWGMSCECFDRFPVLVKLIDANDNLSIQVHPDDEYANAVEYNWGKTEMWYVVDCEENAGIYVGFNKSVTNEQCREAIINNTLTDLLNFIKVKPGDSFFIPAGTVHAIGKGCLIAEIQENSDITYRLSDYGRIDKDGLPRELHIEKALDVASFDKFSFYKFDDCLAKCKYFTVELNESAFVCNTENTYNIYLFISGSGTINKQVVKKGDCFFVPCKTNVDINGELKFLRIYTGTEETK